jgi:peroxiredoxin
LRSLQENLPDLTARGVRVVAVSVDPPEVTSGQVAKRGYTFTFLSDPKAEVIRRYDVLHEKGGPHGADIARPAEFLIDPSGTVRWRNLTEDYEVRVRGQQVLDVLDSLGVRASGPASR